MTIASAQKPAADTARISDLVGRRAPGFSLEAPFYTDRHVFDHDMDAVFAGTWIYVAAEPEIREPGDFITVDLGPYSVIVLRDDDDGIRAFHNVCRHRGSRLFDDPCGSTGNIVCRYHQWTYGTNGALLSAGTQAEGFDRACFGLKPVAVESVAGLIFICLAADPPDDFADFATTAAPYIAPHALNHTKVAAQDELIENGNWKLVMENNRECYHCEGCHPELTSVFFPTYGYAVDEIPPKLLPAHARYLAAENELETTCRARDIPYAAVEELRGRPTAYRVQREALDGAGESYTADGSAASTKLLGDLDVARLGRLSLHHQPNSWFHFQADHIVCFSVRPLSVDRTLLKTTWLVHEDAEEGVDYDVERLTDVWRHTNSQDAALVTRAQSGIVNPAYEPGPYAPNEYQVEDFIAWYIERLAAQVGQ